MYDNFSWEQLPPEAQDAAMVLGYTGESWDADEDPVSEERIDFSSCLLMLMCFLLSNSRTRSIGFGVSSTQK